DIGQAAEVENDIGGARQQTLDLVAKQYRLFAADNPSADLYNSYATLSEALFLQLHMRTGAYIELWLRSKESWAFIAREKSNRKPVIFTTDLRKPLSAGACIPE